MTTNIRELTLDEIKALVADLGEKPYRAKQLWEWLWKKKARSFDDMSDLPKAFREKLAERTLFRPLTLVEDQLSEDGTVKCAFKTWDGHVVEGVLIPTPTRLTACISSQIGCSLTCSFCATGKLKRIRNLDSAEVVDQVTMIDDLALKYHKQSVTNIVYMGMGEPLLNYANTLRSAERIMAQDGLGLGARRVTVSTAGIAKMIRKLADDGARFNLALSLHAANDEKRRLGVMSPASAANAAAASVTALHASAAAAATAAKGSPSSAAAAASASASVRCRRGHRRR